MNVKEELYREKRRDYFRYARHEIVALVPAGPNRVLEIGCGSGATLQVLKATGRASEIVGVDIVSCGASLDRVLIGDIEQMELPYDSEYFDVILCGDVLEHLLIHGGKLDAWRNC